MLFLHRNKNMKNLKLRTVITASVLLINTLCISLLYLIANSSLTASMKSSELDNLNSTLKAETKIIEEYVYHQEYLLTAFSKAPEVIEFLKNPEDENKRLAAQKCTEEYYSSLDNWEGLYIGEWNTHVIAHSNTDYVGMITRTGEPLKALQNAMSEKNGLYNAGIIISPASQKLILSLYCPVFDYDGETIIGYVGGGPFADSLEKLLAYVESETATYYMINSVSKMYIFAQEDELMATEIKDELLLSIISDAIANDDKTDGKKEYVDEIEGKSIAVYQNIPQYGWVLVSCNSEKNIYADVNTNMRILLVICILSNLIIGVLSWIIIRLSTKPLKFAAASISQLKEMNLDKDHKLDKYINTKSEIGQISTAIDSLYDSIKDMLEAEKEKQAAIAANESKSLFFASMSHEIRTPINVIIGMNDMILRENKDEAIEEYSSHIKSSSQMLLGIVNDILDFSKIEAGKFQIVENEYSLSSLLNDEILMISAYIREKNIKLNLNIDEKLPSVLKGDDIRIKQILNNLLSNAAKYTDRGIISFSAKEINDESGFSLLFTITDTGIGIKKEDLPNIFERFKRLDVKTNHGIEGTGLGLSITKQLIDAMNGEINIKSIYGKGSSFTVRIPQTIVDETPIGKLNADSNTANKTGGNSLYAPNASILVVDDYAINIRVVMGLLKQSGINVDFATSGIKCLEKTKTKKYDLILMDHMMPELDGIETLRLIRSDKENLNSETPAIALTANVVTGAEKTYKKEGFAAFLSKPIDANKLEEMLIGFLMQNNN